MNWREPLLPRINVLHDNIHRSMDYVGVYYYISLHVINR